MEKLKRKIEKSFESEFFKTKIINENKVELTVKENKEIIIIELEEQEMEIVVEINHLYELNEKWQIDYPCTKKIKDLTKEWLMKESKYRIRLLNKMISYVIYDRIGYIDEVLEYSIEDLGLSTRAITCLKREKVYFISDLATLTRKEISQIIHLGKKSVDEISEKMKMIGYPLKEK